jgi:hypothetical protein
VPTGDLDTARHVRQLTAAVGLSVVAYDSYYRSETGVDTFLPSRVLFSRRATIARLKQQGYGATAGRAAYILRLFQ